MRSWLLSGSCSSYIRAYLDKHQEDHRRSSDGMDVANLRPCKGMIFLPIELWGRLDRTVG